MTEQTTCNCPENPDTYDFDMQTWPSHFCGGCNCKLLVVNDKPCVIQLVDVESIVAGCSECGNDIEVRELKVTDSTETVLSLGYCNRCRVKACEYAYLRGKASMSA